MRNLEWKTILSLSLFGPVMGLLTLFGVLPFNVEGYVWLVISVVSAVTIANRIGPGAFINGVATGFLQGATSKLVQGIFSDTYAARNPGLMEKLTDIPEGMEFKYFVLMLVPFVGIGSALVLGLLTFLAGRLLRREDETGPGGL
jgi:hypothetical protein